MKQNDKFKSGKLTAPHNRRNTGQVWMLLVHWFPGVALATYFFVLVPLISNRFSIGHSRRGDRDWSQILELRNVIFERFVLNSAV